MEGGSPTIVTNSEGGRTTSVVAYAKNGDRLVGQVRSPAPPDPLSTNRRRRRWKEASFPRAPLT